MQELAGLTCAVDSHIGSINWAFSGYTEAKLVRSPIGGMGSSWRCRAVRRRFEFRQMKLLPNTAQQRVDTRAVSVDQ
jgi:hypothetical protein